MLGTTGGSLMEMRERESMHNKSELWQLVAKSGIGKYLIGSF
jgi:hypothetical protein